ncbi:GntR family transcriptional regulator [Burkholderia sp. RF4-BP95]|uniref:GntR family transcriptional regulator n=1 Tax=Burkholderia sp. RF4-BP95 TaxID=1637845 RepID=UPI0009E6B25A|nr:winged helix-turn-helix domain-containing protein [Burkholderia sp. RF4-BP95]
MQPHYYDTSFRCARSHSTLASATDWHPDFASIRGHVANAIADQIEEAIRSGHFKPGDKLPTQRAIAEILGFHLNTVYAAYRELARRGLTKGCARRGTFVIECAMLHKSSVWTK